MYKFTKHFLEKLRYYQLSENRIKRIIRHPERSEEAIVPGLVAVMQKSGGKRKTEIWAMYKLEKNIIKIITCWRYPGKSPKRNPIPENILIDIKKILF